MSSKWAMLCISKEGNVLTLRHPHKYSYVQMQLHVSKCSFVVCTPKDLFSTMLCIDQEFQ